MYKPDDKDIDRLSRDAAEHYRAPGEPSWDTLQQILDKELPREKEKKRRGFFFFFFLLLGISVAGAGVWYGLQINTAGKKTTTTGNTASKNVAAAPATASAANEGKPAADNNVAGATLSTQQAATKEQPATTALTPPGTNKPQGTAVTAATQDAPDNASTGSKITILAAKNTRVSTSNYRQATASNGTLYTGKRLRNKPGAHDNSSLQQETGTESIVDAPHKKARRQPVAGKTANEPAAMPEKTATITADETDTGNIKNETTVVPEQKDNQPAAVAQDTAVVATTPAVPVVSDKKDAAMVARSKKKSSSQPARAINIGLTAGLDQSTVKFTYGDDIGYNIGLMGGYQFSKHWSAYTGIIYTKKNYTLNGNDYHPPKHYWTQYVQLEKVDGYCRMWELPLLARYTFSPASKTAFFASTGLSSYFMKKQGYTYSYKSNGIPGTSYWTNDSTFNHVFSILHISAGFEKSFGKHMNWQIEPYAKIPLGGVGFGNIRLSSFGINLTVQYRQPVKR